MGFSQLLFAEMYETCLWECANTGATLISLLLSLIALPSPNLCSSEPRPWCMLKHSKNLCFNSFFFLFQNANERPLNNSERTIFLVITSPQIKTFNRKCSPILSGIVVPPPLQLLSKELIGDFFMQILLCPKSHTALVSFNSIDLVMICFTSKTTSSEHSQGHGRNSATLGSHRASFLVPGALLNKGKNTELL